MTEITTAVALLHGGNRAGARSQLQEVWSRISNAPLAFHKCVLSHFMADAQDAVTEELAWDIRALDAALHCTDAETQCYHHSLSILALMPSLHLNLAEDYFNLGDFSRSRNHLESACGLTGELPDNSYGQMIKRGIERVAKNLDSRRMNRIHPL